MNKLSPTPDFSPHPIEGDALITLIMPIFNERDYIQRVLERIRALPFRKQLVLVDDCSTDGTGQYLDAHEAGKPDAVVIHHDYNQGKGAAIRTGLKYVKGDVVIIQDADLEYQPEELPKLIEPIITGEATAVFGSRFMGKINGMRLPNRIANYILSGAVAFLYGQRLTDEATCYKVFRSDLITSFKLRCQRFEFCPEVTAKTLKAGVEIKEVPITYMARTFEEGKKIGWRDFVEAIRVLASERLR